MAQRTTSCSSLRKALARSPSAAPSRLLRFPAGRRSELHPDHFGAVQPFGLNGSRRHSSSAPGDAPDRVRARFPQQSTVASSSTSSPRKPGGSGVKVGTLFLALSILGLGATSVGLYNYYTSLKTFPEAIRTELRSALRCKASQDYVNANKFFGKAWDKIIENTDGVTDKLDLLKITGVAVSWSEMLEEAGRRLDEGGLPDPLDMAYTVLCEGYDYSRNYIQGRSSAQITIPERLRVVALAVKLSELAEGQPNLEDATEQQLTWAVEEVLKLSTAEMPEDQRKSLENPQDGILLAELGLPAWLSKTDVGGTLEALGNLYARKGNVEYAMPLYLQTISLLLPPPGARKQAPTTQEKCHAAMVMNNLSSLIASAPRAPSKNVSQTGQARAWAGKALQVSQAALDGSKGTADLLDESQGCKPVIAVALYNMGMLALLDGDKEEARRHLEEAQSRAKEWQLREAERRASDALRTM